MLTRAYRDSFSTLANEVRLKILYCLRGGERNVTELTRAVGVDQSQVSHALRRLQAQRFIRVERRGPYRYYLLDSPELVCILDDIELHRQRRKTERK